MINAKIVYRHVVMTSRKQWLKVEKCPGGDGNPIDCVTRVREGWLADRLTWRVRLRVVCECIGICEHVQERLAGFLATDPGDRVGLA